MHGKFLKETKTEISFKTFCKGLGKFVYACFVALACPLWLPIVILCEIGSDEGVDTKYF